jgi:phage tail-like protein
MARPKSTDFLHNFRFHVIVQALGGQDLKSTPGAGDMVSAGFNSVSTPSASQGAVEYREGHYIYTQKYTGLPTVENMTMMRGVALKDGTFWGWLKDVIEGNNEYRADIKIYHFHRDSKPATSTVPGNPNVHMAAKEEGSIEYLCREAFPVRHKVSSDLNATGAEVSIQEIELAYEYFDVIDHSLP